MIGTGHVFVVRGDLRRLNADAWLLPTDRALVVEPHWLDDDARARLAALDLEPPIGWRDGRRAGADVVLVAHDEETFAAAQRVTFPEDEGAVAAMAQNDQGVAGDPQVRGRCPCQDSESTAT